MIMPQVMKAKSELEAINIWFACDIVELASEQKEHKWLVDLLDTTTKACQLEIRSNANNP